MSTTLVMLTTRSSAIRSAKRRTTTTIRPDKDFANSSQEFSRAKRVFLVVKVVLVVKSKAGTEEQLQFEMGRGGGAPLVTQYWGGAGHKTLFLTNSL